MSARTAALSGHMNRSIGRSRVSLSWRVEAIPFRICSTTRVSEELPPRWQVMSLRSLSGLPLAFVYAQHIGDGYVLFILSSQSGYGQAQAKQQ